MVPWFSSRFDEDCHPFDIDEDQVEELRKLALEDRMRGGAGSQSAMVREAIDDYYLHFALSPCPVAHFAL